MKLAAAVATALIALALVACPPDVIDHGDVPDGGPPDASGPLSCGTNADCPCGEACFSLDGGANTCNHHPPLSCTVTSDCIHAIGPSFVCIETFRDGGSCGLSCEPDAG